MGLNPAFSLEVHDLEHKARQPEERKRFDQISQCMHAIIQRCASTSRKTSEVKEAEKKKEESKMLL